MFMTFVSRVTAHVTGGVATLMIGLSLVEQVGNSAGTEPVPSGSADYSVEASPSIVVLPLDQPANGPCAVFGSMLAESIASDLVGSGKLRVVSSMSGRAYKASDRSVPEIKAAADASFVLEGAVQCDPQRLRVTVRLIDAVLDYPVWSATLDRDHQPVLSTQDELTSAIGAAIREAMHVDGDKACSLMTSSP